MNRIAVQRHSVFTQSLHWLTAILVVAAFILGPEGSQQQIYAAANDLQRQWHETLGLSVFTLSIVRILWRVLDQRPPATPAPRWMGLASKVVLLALYGLLFAVPLSAVAGAWLQGHALTLLGGVQIAPWLSFSERLGSSLAELHSWLADSLLVVAGVHAGAAIYHHAMLKDDVLRSMLPKWVPGL